MRAKIGIPRCLFYYKFMPLWETFFTGLGAEVVLSEPTNKRILDDGVKACVDEACLPIKLFHGHVLNLRDRVDYIFIPRFTSISKMEYICPEFGGLPDMVSHTLKGLPEIIDTEINMRRNEKGVVKAAIETAEMLGSDRHTAKKALAAAFENYWDFRYQSLCGAVPFAGELGIGGKERLRNTNLRVAVIGHPYNIYDRHISMDLLKKLLKYNVDIITIEMVDAADIDREASKLQKPMFWNYGRKAYGAALCLASEGNIDGMICVTSFGCGIDSIVYDLIERRIRREYSLPFIIMTIDEHSGQAGFDTRLEAFTDMLRWRKNNENNVSASG